MMGFMDPTLSSTALHSGEREKGAHAMTVIQQNMR